MSSTLLAVKFFIPQPRTLLTGRPQLLDRFTAGLARQLTLISAPAGFGKSTLLSAWMDRQVVSTGPLRCWLSLDPADNQPSRYWTYFLAALQIGLKHRPMEEASDPSEAAAPAAAQRLDGLLDILQTDPPSIEPILDQLLNLLAAGPTRLLLVLDDYHVIQSPEIHQQMTYLLDHQPPNLHLVIATRADPPLPIARLRARGQLSEFRAADLRFSPEEAARFLQQMTGLQVPGEAVNAIQASTEGWIAGLQMAALALQAVLANSVDPGAAPQQKVKEFIATFSGKHIYILDYLTDEVFNHQPPEVQDFLLQTSILDRLSAGLCTALLQPKAGDSSPSQPVNAREVLEYLDKSNLFLIRLDQERQWFRYHHLFADLLRARLEQTWPDRIPALHLRASRWFEQNGFVEDAIHHALASQEWDWAAGLMEKYVTPYLDRGQLAMILKWIDALPASILHRRPVLCVQVAFALAHAGQFPRVPALIEAVETALSGGQARENGASTPSLTQDDLARVRALLTVLRAFGLVLAGKPEPAFMLARDALDTLPGLPPRELAWLNWTCGYASRGMGQLDQAIHYFEIALALGRQAGIAWEDMSTDLGIAYRFSGRLSLAVEVFHEALQLGQGQGGRNRGTLSRVEAFLSAVLLDQNHLDEALAHIQKALDYLQWWPSHNHVTTAYTYLSLVELAFGRVEQAASALEKAAQEQHKGQVMPTVLRLVEYASIRLWLARGDWDALDRWLAAQEISLPDLGARNRGFNEYEDMHLLSLARVWIAKARQASSPDGFERALELLSRLEASAAQTHWVHPLIEINLLQAITLYERGRQTGHPPGDWMQYLTRSLALGLPEGYLRVYLQEGPLLAEMLQAWRKLSSQSFPPALKPVMVKELLDRFERGHGAGWGTGSAGPVEALTEREQDVLQLLAQGLSNKEIAERLVVSEGTVKTHVHNLIGKLGAQSRTQVLARARELNLL